MRRNVLFSRDYSRTAIKSCSPSERDALLRSLEVDCTAALKELLRGSTSERSFHAANSAILKALRKIGHPLEGNHMYDDNLEIWAGALSEGPALSVFFGLPANVEVDWGPVER